MFFWWCDVRYQCRSSSLCFLFTVWPKMINLLFGINENINLTWICVNKNIDLHLLHFMWWILIVQKFGGDRSQVRLKLIIVNILNSTFSCFCLFSVRKWCIQLVRRMMLKYIMPSLIMLIMPLSAFAVRILNITNCLKFTNCLNPLLPEVFFRQILRHL